MRSPFATVLFVLAFVFLMSGARAATAAPRASAPGVTDTTWYGWEIILVDATSLAIFASTAPEPECLLAVGSYALAAPVVHLANEEGWHALGSLALRTLAPVALGGAALGIWHGEGWGALGAAALGSGLGAAIASVVDIAFLSTRSRLESKPRAAGFQVAPIPRGVSAGFSLEL